MLTPLPNGAYVDLTRATYFYANKTNCSVHLVFGVGESVHMFKMNSPEEAQAEVTRLAAIANSQRSNGAILINNAYYRCGDVQSVDIVSMPLSWGCRVRLTGDRREDIWFDAPKGLSGDELALQLTACEAEAHEYARTLMERVAGAERGRE